MNQHAAGATAEGSDDSETPWKRMPEQLVDWVREYDDMQGQRKRLTFRDPVEQRDALDERIDALTNRIQLTGLTASFFGGFDGMSRLHDAAEAQVGRDNSVGKTLNRLWDGIGGWWA